ncbi:MAG TPA: hypothetical protein VHS58_06565 [Acetobacteraceae bacterium]|jgi:hypothetical protein|nr:hypothetical protein [Acetobacteraceae bacterium]
MATPATHPDSCGRRAAAAAPLSGDYPLSTLGASWIRSLSLIVLTIAMHTLAP